MVANSDNSAEGKPEPPSSNPAAPLIDDRGEIQRTPFSPTTVDLAKEADKLGTRWTAALSSLQKAPLILLAILALWLALLNSYARFNELTRESESQQWISVKLVDLDRSLLRLEVEKQATIKAAAALRVTAASAAAYQHQLADLEVTMARTRVSRAEEESTRKEHAERKSKLKEESLELSVLGTKLLARLAFAPLVFLCALYMWLVWLGSRRRVAQSIGAEQSLLRRAGSPAILHGAGMWFAPLPKTLALSSESPSGWLVDVAELQGAVGWSPNAARRQTAAFRALAVGMVLIVVHVGWIAFEFTSPTAANSLKVVLPDWVPVVAFLSLFAAALCLIRLLALCHTGPERFDGADLPPVSRREWATIGTAVLVTGLAVWKWRSGQISPLERFMAYGTRDQTASRSVQRPRFVAAARLERRRRNRRTTVTLPAAAIPLPPSLVWHVVRATSKVPLIAVHHARADRSVRLLASVTRIPVLVPVTTPVLLGRIDQQTRTPTVVRSQSRALASSESKPRLNPNRTWCFETYALELLAQDREVPRAGQGPTARETEACRALWAGVQLTLRVPYSVPVNLRLADLLAGLCVRVGLENVYLQKLTNEVKRRLNGLQASGLIEAVDKLHLEQARRRADRLRESVPAHATKDIPRRAKVKTGASVGTGACNVFNAKPGKTGRFSLCHEVQRLNDRVDKWAPGAASKTAQKWRRHWSDRGQPKKWHNPMDTSAPGPTAASVGASAIAPKSGQQDRRSFFARLWSREPTPVLHQRKVLLP